MSSPENERPEHFERLAEICLDLIQSVLTRETPVKRQEIVGMLSDKLQQVCPDAKISLDDSRGTVWLSVGPLKGSAKLRKPPKETATLGKGKK